MFFLSHFFHCQKVRKKLVAEKLSLKTTRAVHRVAKAQADPNKTFTKHKHSFASILLKSHNGLVGAHAN
jgi:hypothetical protein